MSWQSLIYVIVVITLTTLGGIFIAQKEAKNVFAWLPPFLSVGTGMLLAMAMTEFIPHAFLKPTPWTPIGLLCGVLIVIIGDKYLAPYLGPKHNKKCNHHSHGPQLISSVAACSSIGCIIVCAFFDGIEIFTAFQLGPRVGWFIAVALLFHVVPEGAIAAGISLAGGYSKSETYRSLGYIACAMLLGVVFGNFIIKWFDFSSTLLPFASGVLLYVSIGHLMPVALKHRWGIWGLIFGAGSLFFLKILSGHHH